MAKIYQFPNVKDKVQLETQMESLQGAMSELYDAIRKVEIGLEMLKRQSGEIEETYQDLVQGYASIVGSQNVANKWLEYCTYVGMERDPTTGEINIYFKPPEEEPDEE